MLSVLSGALLMAASSLIGIAIKRIFRVRYAYFSDAVDFLNLYKREISSLQTPLEDVIKTFVSSSKGAFSDSLQKFADGDELSGVPFSKAYYKLSQKLRFWES